jgi:predicted amidohydrolase
MNDLRVSLVQSDLFWEDPKRNLKQFEKKISSLKGETDLIVLPEMFTTGFSMKAEHLSETMDAATVSWAKEQAKLLGAAIMGSFIVKEAGKYYNRLLFVEPDGTLAYYDKRHLFSFAGEGDYFTSGEAQLIVNYKGWKIMPLICYDLRFPVWSRNTQSYDLLIYVANFPGKRRFAWKQLLTARAIENQTYTVGVNRIGVDGKDISYSGDSCLLDYSGQPLYDLEDQEIITTATLSYQKQQDFRDQFAFLQDGDFFDFVDSK